MGFYNTIFLNGKELKTAHKKTKGQEKLVLNFFRKNYKKMFTPCEVWKYAEKKTKKNIPLTSIRRTITDLTTRGLLTKTCFQKIGIYGSKNHCWTLTRTELTNRVIDTVEAFKAINS